VRRASLWLEILLGPARFWAGVSVLLGIVAAVAYTYGAWYALVLTRDAVPVRTIKERSSWPATFAYEEDGGVRRRVYRPAGSSFETHFVSDVAMVADISSGGYTTYAQILREMEREQEEEEEKAAEEAAASRQAFLETMRETGLLIGPDRASGRSHTVVVDEFSSKEEAARAAQLLHEHGRDATMEPIVDASGKVVSYRVSSGSFTSLEAAEAYHRELQSAGLIGGGAPGGGASSQPSGPSGEGEATADGGSEAPAGPSGAVSGAGTAPPEAGSGSPPEGSSAGSGEPTGGGQDPPPTMPPPSGGGRTLGDL